MTLTQWITGDTLRQMAEYNRINTVATASISGVKLPWRSLYKRLMEYYLNNGLYEELDIFARTWIDNPDRNVRPLRNPASRVVEFYADNLWPGETTEALPLMEEDPQLEDAVSQIFEWSNWNENKQIMARWFAIYGDCFVRVATDAINDEEPSLVYLQNLDPTYVTHYEVNSRNIITEFRMDVPSVDDEGNYVHIEVWDMQSVRVWKQRYSSAENTDDEDNLGTPDSEIFLSDMGIDFIPIAHTKMRNVGLERGIGAFTLYLDKIDEANRMATRLHHMLFRHNKAIWGLSANAMDGSGRPIPPPSVSGVAGKADLDVEDDTVIGLPGNASLQALVPQLAYGEALAILQDHMAELENDMPELSYYSLRRQNLSGIAARTLLGDAIKRAKEARTRGVRVMVRALKMAITVAANYELMELPDNLDDFTFNPPDPFAPSLHEIVETIQSLTTAGVPIVAALRMASVPQETIDMVSEELTAQQVRDVNLAQAYIAEAERQASRTQGFTAE